MRGNIMTKNIDRKTLTEAEKQRLLDEEIFILESTECIARVMLKECINKNTIAKKLGKSNSFVTQVLAGNRNMTLRTFADFLHVLGYRAKISEKPYKNNGISDYSNNYDNVIALKQPEISVMTLDNKHYNNQERIVVNL